MPPTEGETELEDTVHEYTTQEIGQMLSDMHRRQAKYEKTMMNHRYDHENFENRQAGINSSIEESLARLTEAINKTLARTATPPDASPATRGWSFPPSVTIKPVNFNAASQPKLASGAPRFNGDNVVKWIRRIQKYYNHDFTPLRDRLYLTSFLLDDAAEEWFSYWEDNSENKTWDTFLLAVKKRFDPDLYEDYVGKLATLRQTSTVESYQTTFESMLQKASHVGDATLTSLFIAGLSPPIKQEMLTRRPATLQDAFALAQQLAVCHAAAGKASPISTKPSWQPRRPDSTPVSTSPTPTPTIRGGKPPTDYPVIKLSEA